MDVVRPGATGRRWGRARRLAPLVLVALVAAGCAGGGDGDDGRTTAATSTTAVEGPTTTDAPTTTSTTSTTVAPTTTTTTTAPPPPESLPEPAGPLQSGSVGLRTRALQEAFIAQRYDPGPVDGRFGTRTTQAVWAYQALHGLPKDGVVTPELEARILAGEPQGMLRPELGPTHTEVDLTRQVMLVWRDGALQLVSHVSTGSQVPYCEDGHCGDAVTPVGVYRFQRRIDGWRDAPLGRLYNPVYFVGGIAVHGAPSVPNHPASHGCVRIPMDTAERFPSLVANGDTIEVFRS